MSVSVPMPRLGESVSEGTVTRWLKATGDSVQADEPLLEVSTDKVDTEIPSPVSGVLTEIKVAEDETVDVGTELAIIDDGATGGDGGAASEAAPEPAAAPEPEAEPEPAAAPEPAQAAAESAADPSPAAESAQAAPSQPSGDGGGAPPATAAPAPSGDQASYVTPLVRRLAAERGVDLSTLSGTGVGGRIRKQDVLDAAASPAAPAAAAAPAATSAAPSAPERIETPARDTTATPVATTDQASKAAADTTVRGRTEKLTRLRKVIAERMTESLQVSAQLTTVIEADITGIVRLRARVKDAFEAREGVKLTYSPFFALATCEALREHPQVNASIDLEAGTATYHDTVHLGIAVDTERGLLVPVIGHASDLNLAGLARKIDDIARRTRDNHITPDELGGGTFTLTNTGSRGALFDTPIINQPQVGILGTGAVVKRPVVVTDEHVGEVIAVRSIVYLALTYDHRMVDGADAARFLTTVKNRLESSDFESELGL